ncbi:acyltransferase family protein [Streptomyces sp. NBC_01508]|uniref:acyltransferase family protein n=1 Tax=Streptomyces sp. NBC_01508 TaxID=2903888 RepID=UPI0038642790
MHRQPPADQPDPYGYGYGYGYGEQPSYGPPPYGPPPPQQYVNEVPQQGQFPVAPYIPQGYVPDNHWQEEEPQPQPWTEPQWTEPEPAPPAEPDPEPEPTPAPAPAPPPPPALKTRFAAVDGLRGIAILSVLLYHTNWFSNGLFGVDAFFVLSGFLTTLILIREVERTGRIRLGRFYARRFKRLFPGLMITLAVVVGISYLTSPLKEATELSRQALGSLLQIANWDQIARGDAYWDQFGAIRPLSAMWSLSITEQFYVVWPLVLIVAFAVFRRRVLPVAILIGLLFAGSALVAPALWNGENTDFLYLATHTRAVAFMAGALAAFVVLLVQRRTAASASSPSPSEDRSRGKDRGRAKAGNGFAITLASVVQILTLAAILYVSVKVSTYHEPWLYEGGLAVVALLVAVLAAVLCTDRGPLAKLLSFKPLMEIGQISYSLYLLHLPVYWLLLMAWPDMRPYALFILGTGLTWLLSMIMHYTTEQYRIRDWRPARAVPLFTVGFLVIGAGAYYLPTYVADNMRPDGKPLVLTLGDSMAEDFATALSQHGSQYAVVDGGQPGCGVMSPERVRDRNDKVFDNFDSCRAWKTYWKDQLANSKPDVALLHVAWDAAEQQIDGKWLTPCDAAYRSRYTKQLKEAVSVITSQAPEARILLMNERGYNGVITSDWGECYNTAVREFTEDPSDKVVLMDFDGLLCDTSRCRDKTPAGLRLYPRGDDVHFTDAGLAFVTPWLEKEIKGALD